MIFVMMKMRTLSIFSLSANLVVWCGVVFLMGVGKTILSKVRRITWIEFPLSGRTSPFVILLARLDWLVPSTTLEGT